MISSVWTSTYHPSGQYRRDCQGYSPPPPPFHLDQYVGVNAGKSAKDMWISSSMESRTDSELVMGVVTYISCPSHQRRKICDLQRIIGRLSRIVLSQRWDGVVFGRFAQAEVPAVHLSRFEVIPKVGLAWGWLSICLIQLVEVWMTGSDLNSVPYDTFWVIDLAQQLPPFGLGVLTAKLDIKIV